MEFRRLGRAGVRLSELGLGSWLTYGCGVQDDAARACVRRAVELGVNFFDTADVYHHGAAEEFLGHELKQYGRPQIVLATKCFFPMSDDPNDRGLSRKHIFESIHQSLRRLQTDYVDIYQCHRHDPDVEVEEVVRAMDDLVRQGKVLYWGTSEWPAEELRRAHEVARVTHAAAPVSEQPEYSLAARRVETNGVQAACAELGMGMLLWSPLAQGVLSGKYSGGKVPKHSRAANPQMNVFLQHVNRETAERVDQLRPLAEQHRCTLAQLAIAWLLTRAAVTSVIMGASRAEQVNENVAAAGVQLTADELARMDALFPAGEFQ